MEGRDESSGNNDPRTPSSILSARAALLLASLQSRRSVMEETGDKERELRAKRLLVALVVQLRSDRAQLKRLDMVDLVLQVLVVVVFAVLVLCLFVRS